MITDIILIIEVAIILLYGINEAKKILNRFTNYKIDTMISNTKYSEEEIIGHLDYIIQEALDEYVITNITPKNIVYIKSTMENDMTFHLKEVVPNRISKTLMTQLSIVYNDEYIGEFIGRHIYFSVVNYVLEFNIDHKQPEAPQQPQTTNLDLS